MNLSQINIGDQTIDVIPATILHKDGSQETIYIEHPKHKKSRHLFSHMQVVYILIGTLALTMSVYVTYLQLKNMRQ